MISVEDKELQNLILENLSGAVKLRPLAGFEMDFSANAGFRKVFFASSCDCGIAALLSVEIDDSKTDHEIVNALPSLVERLERQEGAFRTMDCSVHQMMNQGRVADADS